MAERRWSVYRDGDDDGLYWVAYKYLGGPSHWTPFPTWREAYDHADREAGNK